MSFKQIYNEGGMARTMGGSRRDNPYYQSENLPVSESPAAYRAWQMKAEAWELGWLEQDQLLAPVQKRTHYPLSPERRAIPLTARAQEDRQHKSAGGMAA